MAILKKDEPAVDNKPATHALVIGVSKYSHIYGGVSPSERGKNFQLGQLNSAARSASNFAKWLWDDYRHPKCALQTLSILLSPSSNDEIDNDFKSELPINEDYAATRENVKEAVNNFKRLCASNKDNIGIIYVAGHGVQLTKTGAIVLLEDFADDELDNSLSGALDLISLHKNMNHGGTANCQYWFVDTCRQTPDIACEFDLMEGALRYDQPKQGSVISPMYLASAPGSQAYGKINEVSLFRQALQWALEKNGAIISPDKHSSNWYVSASSLGERLKDKIEEYSNKHNLEQQMEFTGFIGAAVFHEYLTPPKVNLNIDICPEDAKNDVTWTLSDKNNSPIFHKRSDWPGKEEVDSGIYIFQTNTTGLWSPFFQAKTVEPPEFDIQMEVTI